MSSVIAYLSRLFRRVVVLLLGRSRPAAMAPPGASSIADMSRVDSAGVVEPGQQDAMLKSLAGALRFRGSGYDEIEIALLAANKARCHPPKSDDEVRAIARWAAELPMTALSRGGGGTLLGGLHEDDPLIYVLQRTLGNRTGMLRVLDAYTICGIEPGKAGQDQIVRLGYALRALGWRRQLCRLDGILQYVYVRGTTAEQAVELLVEYDPHMRSVRIEKGACNGG